MHLYVHVIIISEKGGHELEGEDKRKERSVVIIL